MRTRVQQGDRININLKVSPEEMERLEEVAQATGQSRSAVVRYLIRHVQARPAEVIVALREAGPVAGPRNGKPRVRSAE